jgi:ProP effector
MPSSSTKSPGPKQRPDPTIEATLALLCERFPRVFVRHQARRRPLKIGIHKDLEAALDGAVTPADLSRALAVYVANPIYRSRLLVGAWRYDLDGNPIGAVTPKEAQVRPRGKPKPSAPPDDSKQSSAPPAPPPAKATKPPAAATKAEVRRLSLADLRAAALRRKQQGGAS